MKAETLISLIHEIFATLPAAIATGAEVIKLINDTYVALDKALPFGEVTAAEIDDLVRRIVAKSMEIQTLD